GRRWRGSSAAARGTTCCAHRPSRGPAATSPCRHRSRNEETLRSSAVTEDGRQPPTPSLKRRPPRCCDPRPSRRTAATFLNDRQITQLTVAILGRHGGRPPPWWDRARTALETGCDPRPPRRTAATRRPPSA